jgi:hypothetical protein
MWRVVSCSRPRSRQEGIWTTQKVMVVVFACFVWGACATHRTSGYVVPGETLDKNARYFVVIDLEDDRELNALLERGLATRGIEVSSGLIGTMPADAAYRVGYSGQWQWDITWYLLSFSIRIYGPESGLLIATASSLRTSLVRRPPAEVVSEVLNQLFGHLGRSNGGTP